MKLKSRSLLTAAIVLGVVWLAGAFLIDRVFAQTAPPTAKGKTAGESFKNVTTSTLKGLSPSDFLGAMGVMAAALEAMTVPIAIPPRARITLIG